MGGGGGAEEALLPERLAQRTVGPLKKKEILGFKGLGFREV